MTGSALDACKRVKMFEEGALKVWWSDVIECKEREINKKAARGGLTTLVMAKQDQ